MRNVYLRTLILTLPFVLGAIPASAQDERVRLSIGAAAASGTDDNVALTASVGYRFLERLSFDVDFTATKAPGGDFARPLAAMAGPGDGVMRGSLVMRGRPGRPGGPIDLTRGQVVERIAIFPPVPSARDNGDIAIVTTGFRYEFPVQGGRLRPYVGGGLGIARTSQEIASVQLLRQPGAQRVERDGHAEVSVVAVAGLVDLDLRR